MASKEEIMRRGLAFSKLGVAAALALFVLAGPASAQSLVKATFTLPYEVHWGRAVLPAGHYSVQIDSVNVPTRVTTPTGAGRAMVLARSFDSALAGHPTALLITRVEGVRIVRVFNWPEGNRSFVYKALSATERTAFAEAREIEEIPVRLAQH
jgi:hypothetical protein